MQGSTSSTGSRAPSWRVAPVALLALGSVAMAACGGGGGGGGANKSKTLVAANGAVTVEAHDIYFNANRIEATAGTLKVTLLEKGSQNHTFTVTDHKGEAKVSPGSKTGTATFDLTPGTYTFHCTIPGHEAPGMRGTLVVS